MLLPLLWACTEDGRDPVSGFWTVADENELCVPGVHCLSQSVLAVDGAGETFVVYVHDDPNEDEVYDDAVAELIRVSPEGVAEPPQVIGTVGYAQYASYRQLAAAVDDDGQLLVIAYTDELMGSLHVATSTDGGLSFTDETMVMPGSQMVAADVRDGRTAIVSKHSSGPLAATLYARDTPTSAWESYDLPIAVVDGLATGPARRFGPGVALRPSDGQPFVSYFLEPASGANTPFVVWTPPEAAPTILFDSQDVQNDYGDSALAFDGDELVAVALLHDTGPDPVRMARSSDQTSWSAPIPIHGEDHDGYGGEVDLSAADGRESIALQVASGDDTPTCGSPKLVETTDGGASFDPCQLQGAADALAGEYVDVDEDASGRRVVAFVAQGGYGDLPGGVILYSE